MTRSVASYTTPSPAGGCAWTNMGTLGMRRCATPQPCPGMPAVVRGQMQHSLPDLFHSDSEGLVNRLCQKHLRRSME